jgi:hypothetical protein
MSLIEFIRIDGQTIRVTSLRHDEVTGTIELVVVARGSAAAAEVADLNTRGTLSVELPDEEPASFTISEFEQRSVGEGERAMNRFRFVLHPESTNGNANDPAEAETQLDRIERKLDELLKLLSRS